MENPDCWSCDGRSLREVYDEHGAAVFAVALRVAGPEKAVALTQETFVRLWREPGRFDPSQGPLRGFLVAVVRNLALARARSERAHAPRPLRAGGQDQDLPVGPRARERDAAVAVAALGRLSHGCRDAIVAALDGGLSYAEVARALGEAEDTVKRRIRRGLAELAAELPGPAAPPP